MKAKNRNVVTCVILSLVTCGIYALVWGFNLAKEAISVANENDDGTLEAILMIIFCPVGLFLTEKKFAEGCAAKGVQHEDRSVIYLIMSLFGLGLVAMVMMQSDLNKIVPAEAE